MRTTSDRIESLAWPDLQAQLDEEGFAVTEPILTETECSALIESYENEDLFRKRVIMERHNYGKGDYQYFAYPLPPLVAELRAAFFGRLAPIANLWSERLKKESRFPKELDAYLGTCHDAGQKRPTPLILRYQTDGFNCLHQDLYGDLYFPIQVAILLSEPGKDFEGGEFALVERRPRMQSRVMIAPLQRGSAVIFAVNQRPRKGVRGYHRTEMRHGVSRIRSGKRFTLGVIFHDAKS